MSMATEKKAEKKPKNGGKEKVEKFSTNSGHPLTPNESKFIDRYIESGNATQSYIEAYGDKPAARQLASRVLSKGYITEEINFRLECAKTDSIASAEEIMQYFTDVMRGKIKDQFGLEASLGERTKAAQELAKRQIDIPNRLENNEQPELKITLNWERPAEVDITNSKNGDDGK